MPQHSWSSSGAEVMATFSQCLITETQKGFLQIWSGLFTLQSQLETMTEWSEAEFSGKAEWDVAWGRGLVPCDHSRTHLLSSCGSILVRSSEFFFFPPHEWKGACAIKGQTWAWLQSPVLMLAINVIMSSSCWLRNESRTCISVLTSILHYTAKDFRQI